MNEKMKDFYEAVSADEALQAELIAATEGVSLEGLSEAEARAAIAEAVAAFAAAHELDLTAEDILALDAEERVDAELSDVGLEAVAGGARCACFVVGAANDCGCFVVGGVIEGSNEAKICFGVGWKGLS